MCSLSVLFAYKVGLFNIGAAGQYVVGAGASLYCALGLQMPWFVCLIAAILAGALLGGISGALKAYSQRQRGHLLHHAQLDQPLSGQLPC